jgi:hypothetical protein
MTREELLQKLADNPRFQKVDIAGRGSIIGGAKRSV